MLRFERFYALRLRAATRAAFVNDMNAIERGIFRELLPWPRTSAWLAWRLDVDAGYPCPSPRDGRMREVSLSDRGHATARYLEQ